VNPSLLILEDEPLAQEIYKDALSSDFSLRFVETLKDLTDEMEDDSKDHPDILVCDVFVEDGNFVNFLETKKDQFPVERTFVISGVPERDLIERCLSLGVYDYLSKPISWDLFRVKCSRMLDNNGLATMQLLPVKMSVVHEGSESDELTANEWKILNHLLLQTGYRCSRDSLSMAIWNEPPKGKKLDFHMVNLRKKLQPLDLTIEACELGFVRLFSNGR